MKLLIVDNREERAVRRSVDWKRYGFIEIVMVHQAVQLKEQLLQGKPDLVLWNTELDQKEILQELRNAGTAIAGAGSGGGDASLFLDLRLIDCLTIPVQDGAVEELMRRLERYKARKRRYERIEQNNICWNRNRLDIQSQFWKNLCLGRLTNPTADRIAMIARQTAVDLTQDEPLRLALITIKNQDEMWRRWGEDECQQKIQQFARQSMEMASSEDYGRVVIIYSRIAIVFHAREFSQIRQMCQRLIAQCRNKLDADILCYVSEAVYCEQMSETYWRVLAYSKDDVLRNERIQEVSGTFKTESSSVQIPTNWEKYFYSSNPMQIAYAAQEYLMILGQRRQLSEQDLQIFQQDMLQLFFPIWKRTR